MTPEAYCQQRAARSGSSFYSSFRFLDPDRRAALTAVYAFCREVDDVVDECREAEVARAKLDWWREEVGRLFHGTPQHPVTLALRPAIDRYDLPEEYFLELIDGMAMDLDHHGYADFSELRLYCYRVASVVGLMAIGIFGYSERATVRYAHDLGIAFQLTNILRDVGEDARRGRIYLPQDEMARFGVSERDLSADTNSPELTALLQFQANRAEAFYAKALGELPEADRYRQLSGLIMAAIYRRTLHKLTDQGFPVLQRRVHLTGIEKLWLALRTATAEWWQQRKRDPQ